MDPGQEEYTDLTEEEAEIIPEEPKPVRRIKKVAPTQQQAQVEAPVAVPEIRYTSYHAEEVKGVVDKETNRIFPDLDSQMAEIMNKVDNIEKSIG